MGPEATGAQFGPVLTVLPDAENAQSDIEMAAEVDGEESATSGSEDELEKAGIWLRDEEPSDEEMEEEAGDREHAVNVEGALIVSRVQNTFEYIAHHQFPHSGGA